MDASDSSVKKFKSQSLNSLFRKTASPNNSPTAATAGVDSSSSKSPKLNNASTTSSGASKKAVTTLSTATGAYKLAAMKRDHSGPGGGSSPSSSNNNSPRPEPATVWKKPAMAPSSSSSSPQTTSGDMKLEQTHQDHQIGNDNEEAKDQQPLKQSDVSEEELLKRGIHLASRLSTSEVSHREFNWDEDDDEDDEWQPSPELVKKTQEAIDASTASSLPLNNNEGSGNSSSLGNSSTPSQPKLAPWSMAAAEKKDVVPISEQIKELSEKKNQQSQRGHSSYRAPAQLQNVPRFNYRLSSNTDPASGPFNDHHHQQQQQHHHYHQERYRYHDHEQRYRSDVPPRQELFNASSGQLEMVSGRRGSTRRFSNDRSISPQSWRSGGGFGPGHGGPGGHGPVSGPGSSRSASIGTGRGSDGGEEIAQERENEEQKEKAELEAQAEYMRNLREKARKRKEEELRLEEERKASAKKKADEVAARMAEKARLEQEQKEQKAKQERERKERVKENQKRYDMTEEKLKLASRHNSAQRNQHTSSSRQPHPTRQRAESIDEKEALKAVGSVLDEDDKLWSEKTKGSSAGNSPTTASGPPPSRIWNQPNRSEIGLWGSVQASNSRFSSALLPTDDVFMSKDDLDIKKTEHVWQSSTDWRPKIPSTQSQPSTPSTALHTPENRGISKFFPSPNVDSNMSSWHSGAGNGNGNGSPGIHRDLIPGNFGNGLNNTAFSRTRSSPVNDEEDSSPKPPRVVLPPAAEDKKKSNVQSFQEKLPVPARPKVGGPEDMPFPPLAREGSRISTVSANLKSSASQQQQQQQQQQQKRQKDASLLPRSKNQIRVPIPKQPVINTKNLEAAVVSEAGAQLVDGKKNSVPRVKIPLETNQAEISKFEVFPQLPPVERGREDLVAHLSHYRDKDGRLHRREYEIDYGKPLSTWLIRLPGYPQRTILTRDHKNNIVVGEPPKRPSFSTHSVRRLVKT